MNCGNLWMGFIIRLYSVTRSGLASWHCCGVTKGRHSRLPPGRRPRGELAPAPLYGEAASKPAPNTFYSSYTANAR